MTPGKQYVKLEMRVDRRVLKHILQDTSESYGPEPAFIHEGIEEV